ncbi:hypothetical protein HWV62_20332 [Athelia sp. TMB]|nr:hypothetical protein HWV62_20802 [Athelia sp. TMB]KAF7986753.1 hypothetical protein HWV62_20332 [Athelia sp. TMB]
MSGTKRMASPTGSSSESRTLTSKFMNILLAPISSTSKSPQGTFKVHELVVELSQTRSNLNRVRAELQTAIDQQRNMQSQLEIAQRGEDESRTQLQETLVQLAASHDELVTYRRESEQELRALRHEAQESARELQGAREEVEKLRKRTKNRSSNDALIRTKPSNPEMQAHEKEKRGIFTRERRDVRLVPKYRRNNRPFNEPKGLLPRDVVDYVTEEYVQSSGHPSVERLNHAIDAVIRQVQEHAASIVAAQKSTGRIRIEVRPPVSQRAALAFAMSKPGLTDNGRALLLDAALHAVILPQLYDTFFRGEVVPFLTEHTKIMDDVFARIAMKGGTSPHISLATDADYCPGSWATCQRWRSLAVSGFADLPEPPELNAMARALTRDIIGRIAWAYGQPRHVFEQITSLPSTLLRDMDAIVRDAYELSIVMKRDVSSVRLSVYLDDRLNRPFDIRKEQNAWPQMRSQEGDIAVGNYSFGLQRHVEDGGVSFLALPRVVTTALLREVERNAMVV